MPENFMKVFAPLTLTCALAVALAGCTAAPAPKASTPAASASNAASTQVLQKATAMSLGNMAWESVSVETPQPEGNKVKWTAATPTGKWRCQADPDGSRPYCER